MSLQSSLFEPSLFDDAAVRAAGPGTPLVVGPLSATVRHQLARGAWVDLLPSWLTGGDLLERLLEDVPWHGERRAMYDRVVDVPRLLCHYGEGEPLPHPALDAVRAALNARYEPQLGEPLVSAGLCLYRDGADSVAWHGDTIGRGRTTDTVVAILSLGSPRELLLRPRGGGALARRAAEAARSTPPGGGGTRGPGAPAGAGVRTASAAGTIRHTLHDGDLVVMGGSCQRTWEHAIPKTARLVGPRVSIQFRPRGVS